MSSVIVPITTRVFSGRERAVRRESDKGGRLMRDMKRRRRTTRLKGEVVRPVISKVVRCGDLDFEEDEGNSIGGGRRLTS